MLKTNWEQRNQVSQLVLCYLSRGIAVEPTRQQGPKTHPQYDNRHRARGEPTASSDVGGGSAILGNPAGKSGWEIRLACAKHSQGTILEQQRKTNDDDVRIR